MVTLEPGRLYKHGASNIRRMIISAERPRMISGMHSRHQTVTCLQTEPSMLAPRFLVQREAWPDDWIEVAR